MLENINNDILHISSYVTKLLDITDYNIPMSVNEIMETLKIKSKETFRVNYLDSDIKMDVEVVSNLIKVKIIDRTIYEDF